MFWIKVPLLKQCFSKVSVPECLRKLNTIHTLDPHWYLINYPELRLKNTKEAKEHYTQRGKREGKHANCLEARHRKARRYIPDGMIEHAYERFFGLMVEGLGSTVVGV